MIFLLVLASLIVVSPTFAAEPICPDGTNPRGDIVWCSDYDSLANCATGQETVCWQNNHYASSPTGGSVDQYKFKIVGSGGVVGQGYVTGTPRIGGTGAGQGVLEPIPDATNTTAFNVRYYIRYHRYPSNQTGVHGPQVEASGTGGCTSALKFQGTTWGVWSYYPFSCGVSSFQIPPNTPADSRGRLQDGRWYAVEMHASMDTVWSPRIDTTASFTMKPKADCVDVEFACITRTSGSFITDGWSAGVRLHASGFTNPANNRETTVHAVTSATELAIEGTSVTETATGRLRSMEWNDANGTFRLWFDGVLTVEYTNINFGGVTDSMRWGWRAFLPENYYHPGVPVWGYTIDFDNFVYSNNGTYIGCANSNPNVTTCPGDLEGSRGTGNPATPIAQTGWMYEAWLGRHPAGDCTSNGDLGAVGAYYWRYSGANSTLQSAITHGSYVNQGCKIPVASLHAVDGAYSGGHSANVGTIITVTDGQGPSDCTNGGGSDEHTCQCTVEICNSNVPTGTWVATGATDAALKAVVTSSGSGSGVAQQTGPLSTTVAWPQWASYGWIYLPHPCGSAPCNDYNVTNLALAGFSQDFNQVDHGYLALSVSGGNWAVRQQSADGATRATVSTSTPVTFDAWHEYELVGWSNGTSGCAGSNGCVGLMIDHARILTKEPVSLSLAWLSSTAAAPTAVIGILDFQGTPPFTVYYDDNTVATVSAWSQDGWGTETNPLAGGGSGGSVVKGVTLKGVTVK